MLTSTSWFLLSAKKIKKNLSEKVKKTLNSTYKTENIDINCKKRQILSEKSKKKKLWLT